MLHQASEVWVEQEVLPFFHHQWGSTEVEWSDSGGAGSVHLTRCYTSRLGQVFPLTVTTTSPIQREKQRRDWWSWNWLTRNYKYKIGGQGSLQQLPNTEWRSDLLYGSRLIPVRFSARSDFHFVIHQDHSITWWKNVCLSNVSYLYQQVWGKEGKLSLHSQSILINHTENYQQRIGKKKHGYSRVPYDKSLNGTAAMWRNWR